MRDSIVETLIGVVVVAVAAAFLWFALANGGEASASGKRYEVSVRFDNVSGVSTGTDVRIAGVKAGVVRTVEGDPSRFDAVVVLALDEKWTLPEDSDARISQDGLLGGSYIAISPGAADETEFPIAKDGTGEIIYARGSVDLLTLVGSLASGTSE